MENKYFYCANKQCSFHSMQLETNIAQELEGHKLCKDCFNKGLRLKQGVVVVREKKAGK